MSEIVKRLDTIIEKLDVIILMQRTGEEMLDLLDLPDHIRKTVFGLTDVGGQGTAEEVAEVTGRARAVESGYLNQLILMGWVTKERNGRKTFFTKVQR